MARSTIPRLYLGTMTFAWKQASSVVNDAAALTFLGKFAEAGGVHVDTARIYAGGETEPMLGRAFEAMGRSSALRIGSKAHPSEVGGLSRRGMRAQLEASLAAVGVDSFAEYYLHQPDTEHALLDSLRETDAMVREGLVHAVGMSNYHVDEVERAFELCDEHGLARPTVYQGLYNPLNRQAEDSLLPMLRAHGCSFVAFNPLAAGLLSGAHRATAPGAAPAGRFRDNPNYLPRFYTEANFAALDTIREACDAHGWPMLDAAYCWLLRHSALSGADGLLLGASSVAQLEENLAACERAATEALPTPVAGAFESVWTELEPLRQGAFPYWRSYSADMPERSGRDQGASYQAHGPGSAK